MFILNELVHTEYSYFSEIFYIKKISSIKKFIFESECGRFVENLLPIRKTLSFIENIIFEQ